MIVVYHQNEPPKSKVLAGTKGVDPIATQVLAKLLGYDCETCYKKGSENKVGNALSLITRAKLLNLAVSTVSSDML